MTPAQNETVSKKRRKVAESCKVCRAKKTRCDGQRPVCSPCLTKAVACEYNDATLPVSVAVLTDIQARLQELEQHQAYASSARSAGPSPESRGVYEVVN